MQCSADADCFAGGVCNAGGTCVLGAKIDKDKSTIDISQPLAVADGQDEVTITVTLRDAQGNALPSRGVHLDAPGAGNTLTQPPLATNSVGQVVGKLVSTKAGTKTITAIAGIVEGKPTDRAIALSGTGTVVFVADAAHVACAPGAGGANCSTGGTASSSFAVTAADGTSAPVVVVDTATGVRLHVVLQDANGNPIAGAPVNFSAIGASMSPATGSGVTGADGSFDTTVSSTVAQVATVVLTAGGISVTKSVTFRPGPVSPGNSTLITKVGSTECGLTPATTCTIPADNGKINIQIIAKDAFNNLVPDAPVWFEAGDPTSGNSIAASSAQADYCAAKSPAVVCEGLQARPLFTQGDGSVSANFTSVHAGTKNLIAHLNSASAALTFVVTAGAPDATMSQFVVLGHPDGTPVIANGQLGATSDAYLVGAYVADKYDNPIQGVSVSFNVVACTGGPPCAPGASVAGDAFVSLTGAGSGTTAADGTFSAYLSALLVGTRSISVTGAPLTGAASTVNAEFAPGPVSAAQSTLSLTIDSAATACSTCSVSSDAGHVAHVKFVLKDVNGNDAPNQDVTLDAKMGSGIGAPCVPCTFTLPSNVGAVYTADLASSQAQPLVVTVDVTTPGLTAPVHIEQPLAVTAGAVSASTSTVAIDGAHTSSPLTANGTATSGVVVTLKDAQGNLIDGKTVTGLASGSGNTVSLATAGAAGSGQYFFTFTSTVAEQKTFSVSVAGGPALAQTAQFTFVPGSPSAGNSAFTAAPSTIFDDGVNGSTLTLTVKDANNNPLPNLALASITANPANGAFTPSSGWVTNASGTVTVIYKSTISPVSEQITAAAAGGFSKQVAVTVNPANPNTANSSMTLTSPVTAGTTASFVVTEKSNANLAISGHTVTVACNGGATVAYAGSTQVTNANGQISGTVTSNVAGTQNCVATDSGALVAQANVTFNPDSAHPANVVMVVAPSSIPADFSTASTVTVTVKDGFGNLAPGVAVAFASSAGTDSLSCASSCMTGNSGTASTQVKAKASGVRTISATVTGLSSGNPSSSLTVTPGAAAQLAFTQQPVNVNAGTPMAPVKVTVEDQFGNPVPTATTAVTVKLATSSGGSPGTLANNTVNAVGGVASFNALVPTGTAGGLCDGTNNPCRTLVATAAGLAQSPSSNVFHVVLPFASNGAEGALNVTSGTVVIPANGGSPHQYTTITIAAGARVVGDGNGVLDLRAQGDVVINGALDVSGGPGGSVGNQVNGGAGGGGAGNSVGGANGPYNTQGGGGLCINTSFSWVGCTASIGGLGGGGTGGGYGGVAGSGGYGGAPMGGGGAGGSAGVAGADYDYYPGGGGGGGGAGGGAGGFGGADGCVAAGAAGGGGYGGSATGCGATGQGGGQACPGPYSGGNGAVGASGCTPIAGSGGGGSIGCDAASDLAMATTFRPGSGGGGGGNGGDHNGEARSGGGGGGGGGGGAVRVTSPTRIVLGSSGAVLARGGNGGNGGYAADDCVDDSGGGGGGGSGGALWLQAPILTVPASATISAAGGSPGNAGATAAAGPGGGGGIGRIRLSYDPTQSSVAGNNVSPSLPSGANASGKAFVVAYPQ